MTRMTTTTKNGRPKKKADCTLWRRQKVPQRQNFTKRVVWTVEKKISHQRARIKERFLFLAPFFGVPQKNTPKKTHSFVFPRFKEEKEEEKEEERPRARMKRRVFWG